MVTDAGADREAAHFIRLELADGFDHDIKFMRIYGRVLTGAVWECFVVVRLGIGGPRALSGLVQMPLQIFYLNGTVPCNVFKCEAWPRGIVSSFYFHKPRGVNRESCTGVQIANQGG